MREEGEECGTHRRWGGIGSTSGARGCALTESDRGEIPAKIREEL
jgi:hypothetical protein